MRKDIKFRNFCTKNQLRRKIENNIIMKPRSKLKKFFEMKSMRARNIGAFNISPEMNRATHFEKEEASSQFKILN